MASSSGKQPREMVTAPILVETGSPSSEPRNVAQMEEPRESLLYFAQNYEPGQRVELMGGFMHYAGIQTPPWTHGTRAEWLARYEEFRTRPA